MLLFRILLAFFIVVTGPSRTIFAQQATTSLSQLALEVYFYPNEPPAYQEIYKSTSGGAWYSRFHQIKSPGPDDFPVNAVDIKPSFAEDGIRVTVSVLFGELHEKEKQVGVYAIHEGDKIKIQELAQFGIDPFIISVVNFTPALFDLPEFISKAKSLEYIGIQPTASTMPAFRVAVRNVSNKNVRAIFVRTLKGGAAQVSFLPQGKEGAPLIQPGNAFEFDARVATRPSPTPTGHTQATLPGQVIEVITAIFDDGSFEGEAGPALNYGATLRGEKTQLARVINLFQRAIDDHQSDSAVTIEALTKSIATLNVEADPALGAEIIAAFGQPVKQTAQDLKGPIEIGMKTISSHALNMTKQFQLRNPRPEAGTVDRWLATVKQHYEDWLHRL